MKKRILIFCLSVLFIIGGCKEKEDSKSDSEKLISEYEVQIVCKNKLEFSPENSFLGYKIGYVEEEKDYVKWAYKLLDNNNLTGVSYYGYPSFDELYRSFSNEEIDFMILSDLNKKKVSDDLRVVFEDKQELEIKTIEPVDIANEGFVVLLNGIDSSGDDITNIYSRADIQILLVVNPKDHHVNIQVLPRDLYVEIPCANNLKSKLNRSNEQGGIKCNIAAIEQYFDNEFRINYYFRLNFQGFRDFFESFDEPIYVESNYNFSIAGWNFKKGTNKIIHGDEALCFCRERKSLPQNDVSRGYHQMNMMQAIIKTFLENPSLERVYKIYKATEGNVETNFKYHEFAQLYKILMEMKDDMDVITYSMKGSNQYPVSKDPINGQRLYYFIPEEGQKEEVLARIKKSLNRQVTTIK